MGTKWYSRSPGTPRTAPGVWMGLFVSLVVAATLAPDRALAQEAPTRELIGVVFDNETKEPVTGVLVIVQGTSHRALTDTAGVFRIPRLEPGLYTFEFRKLGYEEGMATVHTVAGEPIFVALDPKPLVLEGLQVQVNQLESRLRRLPYSSFALDEELLRGAAAPNAWMLLRNRAGLMEAPCWQQAAVQTAYSALRRAEFERLVTADDLLTLPERDPVPDMDVQLPVLDQEYDCIISRGRPIRPVVCIDDRTAMGIVELMTFPVDDIYRIEVIRAGQMIRLYTSSYIEIVSSGQRQLMQSINPMFC